jgi:predicted Zn-dependent protease
MRAFSDRINRLFELNRYATIERLVRRELAKAPRDHWLLSRLSSAVYEQRRYAEALSLARRAQRIAPYCPMVLWDLAGAHDMLGQEERAIAIWHGLIRRGVERLATEECGEGRRDARVLVANCWFRLAKMEAQRGRAVMARRALAKFDALGGPTRSSYRGADLDRLRARLEEAQTLSG